MDNSRGRVSLMVVVGILLLSGLVFTAVESVGYVRGGYNSAFWRLPLDEKLDHVAEHRWEWWWISIWSLVGLFAVTAGVFGFTRMLSDQGEPTLSHVATGGYVVAVFAWVFGVTIQAAAVSEASLQRADSGTTPSWLHPLWSAAYLSELTWIIGSNIVYALAGGLILRTNVVADWVGWVALVGGALTAAIVGVRREGFPQLGILIPALIGIAVLIEAL